MIGQTISHYRILLNPKSKAQILRGLKATQDDNSVGSAES